MMGSSESTAVKILSWRNARRRDEDVEDDDDEHDNEQGRSDNKLPKLLKAILLPEETHAHKHHTANANRVHVEKSNGQLLPAGKRVCPLNPCPTVWRKRQEACDLLIGLVALCKLSDLVFGILDFIIIRI